MNGVESSFLIEEMILFFSSTKTLENGHFLEN